MAIRICGWLSWENCTKQVEQVSTSIGPETSVEEFQKACRENPGFRFENGGSDGAFPVLHQAAFMANLPLVKYILDMNRNLINAGEMWGRTPLFLAIGGCSDDEINEQVYETAVELLQRGADPNLGAEGLGTPLSVALGLERNSKLARLLLTQGAQVDESKLSDEGQSVLMEARQAQAQLVGAIAEGTGLLPPLCGMVAGYAGPPPSS